MTKVTSVPDRLRAAADLFEERNAAYGSNFVTMGPVLHAMFPQGLTVETPDEWQRIFSIVMFAMKTTRYASNIRRGGHRDSLDDQAVYSLMAAYTDDLTQHHAVSTSSATLAVVHQGLIRDQAFLLVSEDFSLVARREGWPVDRGWVGHEDSWPVGPHDVTMSDWTVARRTAQT